MKKIVYIVLIFLLSGCNFLDSKLEDVGTDQITHTVTFDSKGGSFVEPIVVNQGNAISAPSVNKVGYLLEGWYTSLDGGETLDTKWVFLITPVNIDLILYANWDAEAFVINFNSNGGSEVSNIVEIPGETIAKPQNPTKEGYEFAGWYSDSGLENYFIFDTMSSSSINLYADWGTEGVNYTLLDGNTYSVSQGTSTSSDVIIPARHNGRLVTSIGDYAFCDCSSLTSITIPASVTSIGDSAFWDCSSLTSITIPTSVTSIGDSAFLFCSSLTIYAEATSKPANWETYWNYSNRPVVWGYIEE